MFDAICDISSVATLSLKVNVDFMRFLCHCLNSNRSVILTKSAYFITCVTNEIIISYIKSLLNKGTSVGSVGLSLYERLQC
jgi:hypothetical protein